MTDPKLVLKKYWGYDHFRSLQADIIEAVLEGKDTLALMPTGGGKSLCFQVPALCQDGVTLVISPLIALMKDQVARLNKLDIPAAAIYSGMHPKEIERTFDNAQYGYLKLLYISPERLSSAWAAERIKQMPVQMLAVDEAHCISQWGYDFRPAYLKIPQIRDWHPDIPILALTATATPDVVEDIQDKLAFRERHTLQKSFKRDKLAYLVVQAENKVERLVKALKSTQGSVIIYAGTRKSTVDIARLLQRNNLSADYYHAGLTVDERSHKQERWMAGSLKIIVSTNAFGMGIDKSDVRLVVHLHLPESLEAYFQEAGRAGRDGKFAQAVLLYHPLDIENLRHRFSKSFPELTEVRRIYRALGSYLQLPTGSGTGESFDFDLSEFCQRFKLNPIVTYHALQLLQQEGILALTDSIMTQSSLQFVVSHEQLYDYQLRNKNMDLLIKTILRQYHGVLGQPVKLQEHKLAKRLDTSVAKLKRYLEKLQQEKIADYIPKKDKPQITFLAERLPADNLQFDLERYRFRKERSQYRIDQILNYVEVKKCRSQLLLAYFGEIDSPACGVCDVCLSAKTERLNRKIRQKLKDWMEEKIKSDNPGIRELTELCSEENRVSCQSILEQWLQEEQVILQGTKLQWKD